MMPECEYECCQCGRHIIARKPMFRNCFACGSMYVTWLNYQAVIDWLMLNDTEYQFSYR